MGAGASTPYTTTEEALAAGKTQAEVDAWIKANQEANQPAVAAASASSAASEASAVTETPEQKSQAGGQKASPAVSKAHTHHHSKSELVYPPGKETEATAVCNCGKVEMKIKGDALISMYCHCHECQVTHGAPLYNGVYFLTCNLSVKGELGTLSGDKDPSVTFTKGIEHLHGWFKPTTSTSVLIGRYVGCKHCGTTMCNFGYRVNTGDGRIGVFPGTFTKHLRNYPQSWQPRWHQFCESAILPVHLLDDGLPKYTKHFKSPLVKGPDDVGTERDNS